MMILVILMLVIVAFTVIATLLKAKGRQPQANPDASSASPNRARLPLPSRGLGFRAWGLECIGVSRGFKV